MTSDPVWINGAFGGGIDPADRGLTLGDGVFDTLVAFNRTPFAGDRHLARLGEHAAAIGIALDRAHAEEGWRAVVGEAKTEHLILRTTVTRGVSGRGLWPSTAVSQPTVMVSAAPWSRDIVARPVRLLTSTITRNAGAPTSKLKTTGYLDNILAARAAAVGGVDDALLLNNAGKVACTTIANIFIASGDALITPPVADGVLAGIVRGLVTEIAKDLGMQPIERSLDIVDLFAADAVFLTNSVRLVSPVQALDGQMIGGRGTGRARTVLEALATRIRDECGFDPIADA